MTRLCPACGDRAKVFVDGWRCRVCARLSASKFEAAVDEWRRITGAT